MHRHKMIVSLCPSGTDTVFALSAGDLLAACTVQKHPQHPRYALVPKIGPGATLREVMEFRPDIVLVGREEGPLAGELKAAGVQVIPMSGDSLEACFGPIRALAMAVGKGTEAEKVITKVRYGFSRLKEKLAGLPPLRTVFFTGKDPYAVSGGKGLVDELLSLDKLENAYGDADRECLTPHLSSLKLLDVRLVLLPDYPQDFSDGDAMEIGNYTEHALTVFVPGELFGGGASLVRLPAFFEQLNEKMRRFSGDNLADRDKPTYF